MPLFEYRCSACQHLEEVLQKHGEPPPEVCPRCGAKQTLSKELSLTSFQLKGGGWYKDLYSSSKKDSGSTSSESTSSTTSTTTTTTTTTTAASTTTTAASTPSPTKAA